MPQGVLQIGTSLRPGLKFLALTKKLELKAYQILADETRHH